MAFILTRNPEIFRDTETGLLWSSCTYPNSYSLDFIKKNFKSPDGLFRLPTKNELLELRKNLLSSDTTNIDRFFGWRYYLTSTIEFGVRIQISVKYHGPLLPTIIDHTNFIEMNNKGYYNNVAIILVSDEQAVLAKKNSEQLQVKIKEVEFF